MSRTILRIFVTVACLFMIAPILVVVVLSFSGDTFLSFPPSSLSLRWYDRILGDPGWRSAAFNSVVIAVLSAGLSTVCGFLAAYALLRGPMRIRAAIMSAMLMPLIVPSVITAIAVYFVSAPLGLIGNTLWIAIAHSAVAAPIALIICRSAMANIDPDVERAALVHGATPAQAFRRIVIPLALPGVASALLFSFLTSFDELLVSLFLAGARTQTLPVRIWNSLLLQLEPTVAAGSTILIAITTVTLLVEFFLRRKRTATRSVARA